MGKTLIELQSNKGDVLPAHKVKDLSSCIYLLLSYSQISSKVIIIIFLILLQFGTHDVVVMKPNKADLSSPALGQGVVYRLKDSSITIAFDDIPEEGLNSPLRIEKVANEVHLSQFTIHNSNFSSFIFFIIIFVSM